MRAQSRNWDSTTPSTADEYASPPFGSGWEVSRFSFRVGYYMYVEVLINQISHPFFATFSE
jgi:hypothetical protein